MDVIESELERIERELKELDKVFDVEEKVEVYKNIMEVKKVDWFVVYRRLDCNELEVCCKYDSREECWDWILSRVDSFLEGMDSGVKFDVRIVNELVYEFVGGFEFVIKYLEEFGRIE